MTFAGDPFSWKERIGWELGALALALGATLVTRAWKVYRSSRTAGWATVEGKIDSADVKPTKIFGFIQGTSQKTFDAEIHYSYSAHGIAYSGVFRKSFQNEIEAWDFVADLDGKSIVVMYNPDRPKKSAPLEDEIAKVRGPVPPADFFAGSTEGNPLIAPPLRQALGPLTALSAVGLSASVFVNISAVFGRSDLSEPTLILLHVGIFVVWFPAVLLLQKLSKYGDKRDWWKIVLKQCPPWLKLIVVVVWAYSMTSGIWFSATGPGTGDLAAPAMARFFSCVWMAFYSAALAILYAALNAKAPVARCLAGHFGAYEARFCEVCGKRMYRPPRVEERVWPKFF